MGSQQRDDTLKATKTQAGLRTIAIDPQTVKHLAECKERQAIELAKLGIEQNGSTPVCRSDTSGRYSIDNFTHCWARWREEHGFPDVKFHELRHTQATQLLANGVDVMTVARRLGHEDPSITLNCTGTRCRKITTPRRRCWRGCLAPMGGVAPNCSGF